jgi:SAM-dependent methyltransferase
MDNDKYGNFVEKYVDYTKAENGMEVELGRRPALKQFSSLSGKNVLDFGCGPGTNGAELRQLGAKQVIGIDVSEQELKVAQRVDPTSIYLHYNGVGLSRVMQGYHIDAIFASFSFCAIPSATLQCLLADMRRLLGPGGELVIADPNFQRSLGVRYPGELHYHSQFGVPQTDDHLHVTLGEGECAVELFHDIYRSHADYKRLLGEAGFIIDVFEEVRPNADCHELWAEWARAYPPFLVIKAS